MMDYKKLIRSLKSDKRNPDKSKIAIIKEKVEGQDYKNAIESYPLLNAIIKRNSFFKEIENIVVRTPYYFTNTISKEFNWALLQLKPHLTKINSFIDKKNEFENLFFLEKYDDCEKLLSDIKEEFGVNLWFFESKLLLSTYVGGNEANWSLLSDLLKSIKYPLYEFNISASSKRFEKGFGFEGYFNQIQNDINNIGAGNIVTDYFVFKNFGIALYDYDFKNLEAVLFLSSAFSVIDLYLISIDILIYNLCIDSDFSYKEIYDVTTALQEGISSDSRLNNICNLLSDDIKTYNSNDLLIEASDAYYRGNFEESINLCLDGLRLFSTEFEFYLIYSKALIALNTHYRPTKISGIIDDITESLFRYFLFDKDSHKYYDILLKYTIVLLNFSFSKQLYSLIAEIDGHKNRLYYSGIIYSQYISPTFLILINKYKFNNNIGFLEDTLSYKAHLTRLGVEDNSKILGRDSGVIALAEYNYYNKEYKKVIDVQSEVLDFSNFYKEKYIGLLYFSLTNLKQYADAIGLYVKYYFDQELYFRKLDYDYLFTEIKTNEDLLDYSASFDFLIFVSLSLREYDLYEILDEFLASIDVYNVKDIDFDYLIITHDLEKVIYLLKNILVVDVLRYFDYSSISSVEEDRVYILKKLIEIDSDNIDSYESQINNIYRTHSVRKVLKDVDEGRLYIDVENLQKQQVKKLNDHFRRFKEIETFSQANSLIGFNSSNRRDWENSMRDKIDSNSRYNSADYLAFKNIYLESRENFLYSKEYGLESCLSTRIRHGALKNHIRSVFEKLDLITVKSNEEYVDNAKVSLQLQSDYNLNVVVQKLLKEFSKNVDDINLNIINLYMQIRTENSKENFDGLFEYATNDELLFDFYSQYKGFFDSTESIVAIILENLVNYTLIEISKVLVEFFTIHVLDKYENLVNKLIQELKSLELPTECEILTNLNKSKTEIQKELEYISDWFFLSTDSSASFLDITTILHASIELTNKINPLYILDPEISIENNMLGFSNFIFIFNIFFNNVIEHSKVDRDNLKLKVNVYKSSEGDYTIVKFTNNLNPNFSYEENIMKLEEVKRNWNDHSRIERSNKEKGSGFDKIKRILIYEARAKTEVFDFEMKNNEISILLYLPYSQIKIDE